MLRSLASSNDTLTPTWEYIFYIVCIIISVILTLFVPWKKYQIKNSYYNKSYSITSEHILNAIGASMILYIASFGLGIVQLYKSDHCKTDQECKTA